MLVLTVFLLFMFYGALVGANDAVKYSLKGGDAFPWNEHWITNVQNAVVFLIFGVTRFMEASALDTQIGDIFVMGIAYPLGYSFFQNGIYYETRSLIDVPRYNFRSNSKDGEAKINLSFIWRLIGFIAAVLLISLWGIMR